MTHTTQNCSHEYSVTTASFTDVLLQAIRQWFRNQVLKARIQRERRELAMLSDSMLKDIGVDRQAALQEAQRHDIPAGRS